MDTQELHIQIDLLLQKVSSHWNSNFLPQEKDYFINREIIKYIKQRLNPLSNTKRQVVFDTIKRTEDLNVLIKTVPINIINLNQREVEFQLPFDFLYYISSELETVPICEGKEIKTINKTNYLKSINLVNVVNTLTQLRITIVRNNINYIVFDLNNLPSDYLPNDNLPDYKKRFIINNAILTSLTSLPLVGEIEDIEVRYNTQLKVFEFRSNTDFNIIYSINTVNQTITNKNNVYSTWNEDNTLISDLRIIDEEFKTDIKRSYLSKSKDESLTGLLKIDSVNIPKLPNVVINKAHLTYFCRPNKVDLLLNSNSEFDTVVLDEIIANCVEQLKAVISSDTYEKYTQENLLIE